MNTDKAALLGRQGRRAGGRRRPQPERRVSPRLRAARRRRRCRAGRSATELPVAVDDVEREPLADAAIGAAGGYRAFLTAPLQSSKGTYGALSVFFERPAPVLRRRQDHPGDVRQPGGRGPRKPAAHPREGRAGAHRRPDRGVQPQLPRAHPRPDHARGAPQRRPRQPAVHRRRRPEDRERPARPSGRRPRAARPGPAAGRQLPRDRHRGALRRRRVRRADARHRCPRRPPGPGEDRPGHRAAQRRDARRRSAARQHGSADLGLVRPRGAAPGGRPQHVRDEASESGGDPDGRRRRHPRTR